MFARKTRITPFSLPTRQGKLLFCPKTLPCWHPKPHYRQSVCKHGQASCYGGEGAPKFEGGSAPLLSPCGSRPISPRDKPSDPASAGRSDERLCKAARTTSSPWPSAPSNVVEQVPQCPSVADRLLPVTAPSSWPSRPPFFDDSLRCIPLPHSAYARFCHPERSEGSNMGLGRQPRQKTLNNICRPYVDGVGDKTD